MLISVNLNPLTGIQAPVHSKYLVASWLSALLQMDIPSKLKLILSERHDKAVTKSGVADMLSHRGGAHFAASTAAIRSPGPSYYAIEL